MPRDHLTPGPLLEDPGTKEPRVETLRVHRPKAIFGHPSIVMGRTMDWNTVKQ